MALEVGSINRSYVYPFADTGTGLAFALYTALKALKVDITKRDVLPPAVGTVVLSGGRVLLGTNTTFTASFVVGNPLSNKVSIGTETRTVISVKSATEATVDAFFTNVTHSGAYSTYNAYDNKSPYYSGTLTEWNALTPIEQWRVNVDAAINAQLDDQAKTATAMATGLVPYFLAQTEVSVTIPSTLAGLQKLPTLLLPGELTDASGATVTLTGGIQ